MRRKRARRGALPLGMLAVCLVSTMLWAAPSRAAERGCVRQFTFHLTSEGPWPAFMVLKAGDSCRSGFTAGGTTHFKRLYLTQRPEHGRVSLYEGGHYEYFAAAAYRGRDAFMLRVCGDRDGHDGCANLQYTVEIQ